MTTLWQIGEDRDRLYELVADLEGELTPEIEAQLDALGFAADEKIERTAIVIRRLEAESRAVNEEAQRLSERASARVNRAKSLKSYLEREMARLGKEKVEGLTATVAMQKNGPSVKGDLAPDQVKALWDKGGDSAGFVRYTPASFALDKKVVIEAHKKGYRIPDGLTVEQTKSLRIR